MDEHEQLRSWIRSYVAEAGREENVEAFVGAVDAAIVAELPILAEDPHLNAELHASTRSQFLVFLSLLEREKQELLLPPQAVDLAISIARRQLDLNVLLKVYRVATAAVWEWFTQVAGSVPDDGPDRTEVLVYLWDHGGTWINEAIEQLIAVYHAEREAGLHGAFARRTEAVKAVVDGRGDSIDQIADDLGHPVRGWHVGVVLWTDGGSDRAAVTLSQRATVLAGSLSATSLAVPVGGSEVWAWLTTNRYPDLDLLRASALEEDPVVRVALGSPGCDLAGFRTSHREAVDAQHHAVSVGGSPVTLYDDVELACLLAGNEAGARRLVERELGELAGPGQSMERLRETVGSFLRFGGNVESVAGDLIVHRNTVRYRLAQAEELLAHPLTERRTELALALAALERYGLSAADS